MSSVSFLNSTSIPILMGATWSGSSENCKKYSSLSVSMLSDTACVLTILHLDKYGTVMWTDQYTTVLNVGFYKQVVSKSSFFKVTIENLDEQDQTLCKLVTKLSNSAPDDINVTVNSSDVVTANLSTAQGAVSSSNGKLLVQQNVLLPANDGVLCYALDTATNVAIKCDSSGKVAVNVQNFPAVATGLSYCSTSLTHAPMEAYASAKKVMRCICYNDSAQLRYVRLYDSANEPVADNTPKLVLTLQPDSGLVAELGVTCVSAVWIVSAVNHGKTTAYGTVGADEVSVNLIME